MRLLERYGTEVLLDSVADGRMLLVLMARFYPAGLQAEDSVRFDIVSWILDSDC